MTDPALEPWPPDEETDGDGYTGDFYEEDEPIEKILYQVEHGEQVITAPPPGWTGPVRLPPEGYLDESLEEFIAAFRRGWGLAPAPSDERP